jgi:hypothetical protein
MISSIQLVDPCNHTLNIQEFVGTLTPKVGAHFGSVEVHSFTYSHICGSMKCDSQASLLAYIFNYVALTCEEVSTIDNKS